MKWGVWYIHPLVGFAATGWLSRSGTNRDQRPHTPPNCSPTPPHRLRTPSGVRIRRVPEGSLHSFCQRLTAQAREPRPQPRSWDPAPKSAAPQQAPPPLNPTHSNSACFCALFVVFVGLFGGLLGVCGVHGVWWLYGGLGESRPTEGLDSPTGAASGGHGLIRGRSEPDIRFIMRTERSVRSIDRDAPR